MIDALRIRFKLSPMEAEMLGWFINHGKRGVDTIGNRNLFGVRRTHIHKRLGREVIRNEWGLGYYLHDDDREWLKRECGLS